MSRLYPHPDQLYLPYLAPRSIDNVFFALRPDLSACYLTDKIAWQLRGAFGLEGEPLGVKLFHSTMHGIGCFEGLPRDVIEKAGAVAATIIVPPFDIAFDRAMSFEMHGRKRPLVLLGDESDGALATFQRMLGEVLARSGLHYTPPGRFTPHVKLLYDHRSIDVRLVEPVHWTVREFVLIRSSVGQHKHACLGRWELRPENPTIH